MQQLRASLSRRRQSTTPESHNSGELVEQEDASHRRTPEGEAGGLYSRPTLSLCPASFINSASHSDKKPCAPLLHHNARRTDRHHYALRRGSERLGVPGS